jgi:TRAP-type uncharacterized transport system substrate-binding protein
VTGLTFAAEWGTGPAYVIAGWLAAGLRPTGLIDGPMSVQLTRGTLDNLHLLGAGQADVAVTVPPLNAWLAREGKGPFATPYGDLQAIGKLPHHTLLTFIVSADLDVKSIADIRRRRIPVRLGTRIEPYGSVSFVATKILEHYGLTPRDLESWGGRIVSTPPAFGPLDKMLSSEANVILHQAGEAIWAELARRKPVRFLPLAHDLVETLARDYRCTPGRIPRRQFEGVEDDVPCLYWSDLIVVASERLPPAVASALARVMIANKGQIEDLLYTADEGKYSHLTSRVRPEEVFRDLAIPLHSGAAAWARENGYA